MRVAVRADASVAIGTGHVMRCLTLARALAGRGAEVSFLSREVPGHCLDLVRRAGFEAIALPGGEPFDPERDAAETARALRGGCDWLLIDHYGLDHRFEGRLRREVPGIMAVDDLADRRHDCDILLDQNLFDDMYERYQGLTPAECRLFLGPRYALLRDEFIEARRTAAGRGGEVKRLLLFFGGSDPTNETEKALEALGRIGRTDIAADVVVGSSNPLGDRIREICAAMPQTNFLRQVSNMSCLMARADLSLGAGGSTTWERCFLGLPSLLVAVAENQLQPALAADRAGLAEYLGQSGEVSAAGMASALERALAQPARLAAMSRRCLEFMGERDAPVPGEILNLICEVPDAP